MMKKAKKASMKKNKFNCTHSMRKFGPSTGLLFSMNNFSHRPET